MGGAGEVQGHHIRLRGEGARNLKELRLGGGWVGGELAGTAGEKGASVSLTVLVRISVSCP